MAKGKVRRWRRARFANGDSWLYEPFVSVHLKVRGKEADPSEWHTIPVEIENESQVEARSKPNIHREFASLPLMKFSKHLDFARQYGLLLSYRDQAKKESILEWIWHISRLRFLISLWDAIKFARESQAVKEAADEVIRLFRSVPPNTFNSPYLTGSKTFCGVDQTKNRRSDINFIGWIRKPNHPKYFCEKRHEQVRPIKFFGPQSVWIESSRWCPESEDGWQRITKIYVHIFYFHEHAEEVLTSQEAIEFARSYIEECCSTVASVSIAVEEWNPFDGTTRLRPSGLLGILYLSFARELGELGFILEKRCIHCGKPFLASRKDQKFCPDNYGPGDKTGRCRVAYHREQKKIAELSIADAQTIKKLRPKPNTSN